MKDLKRNWAWVGVIVVVLAVAGFLKMPHHTAQASGASLNATSSVIFGMNIYGSFMQTAGIPVTQQAIIDNPDPYEEATWDNNAIYTRPSYGYGSVGHEIYLNDSSFSVDFRVGLKICDDQGDPCHVGWTPWAYDEANNPTGINYSPLVGAGPYGGGTECGDPNATLHNRLEYTYIGVETRPLPAGVVLNNVYLTLYPMEMDYNAPVDSPLQPSGSCSFYGWIAGDTPGSTPQGGGWSNAAFDKWDNASTDGFIIEMDAGSSVFNATPVSSNIPSSFNLGETTTTGTDGRSLEITMKNTGTMAWPAEQGSATGTPTGECDVSINGSSVHNAPAANSSNYGKSCTVDYIYTGTADILSHTGSFNASPGRMQFTEVVPIATTYAASVKTCFPIYTSPCLVGGGSVDMNAPSFISKAYAMMAPICSAHPSQVCETDPAGYDSGVAAASTAIFPGATAVFTLNSLTATSTAGTYSETWQMEDNGVTFGTPFTLPIAVSVNGTPPTSTPTGTTGTITVTSENANNPQTLVNASWDLSGNVTGGFVCATDLGIVWQGTSCSGTEQTYSGVPANTDVYNLVSATTTSPYYSLRSIEASPIVAERKMGISQSLGLLFENLFSTTAFAYTVSPASSQTLIPTLPSAAFVILWTPNANMQVNSANPIALTKASPSQAVTIVNNGAPYSGLNWTIATSTTSGGNWLSVSSLNGTVTNGGSSGASSSVTVSYDPSVTTGTYSGSITITGRDPGNSNNVVASKTIPVSLTLGSGNPPPPPSQTYSCGSGVCQIDASGSGAASCSAACGSGGGAPVVVCTPVSVSVGQTSQCAVDLGGVPQNATWTVTSGNGGTIGASSGVFSASAPGASTIQATLPDGSTASGSVNTISNVCSDASCQAVCSSPTLTASPASIVIPESTNLSYSCSHVTECRLTQGSTVLQDVLGGTLETVSSTYGTTPSVSTTYTLTCTNGNYTSDSTSASVQVTVGGSSRCEQNPNGAGCPGQ